MVKNYLVIILFFTFCYLNSQKTVPNIPVETFKNTFTTMNKELDEEKFYILYKNLKDVEFPLEKIKSFYYFEAGRWDLVMTEGKVIKLPIDNYLFSLKDFMKSKNDNSFNSFKIYDYRIKNQLILN